MLRRFANVDEFCAAVGTSFGESPWLTVDQARIDGFADATGDHQWIHVDPERAARGPLGTTIAHGYLTLSLVPVMLSSVYAVDNLTAVLNYGANGIRLLRPVPVDARIQASATVAGIERTGVRATLDVEVRIDDDDPKRACVAEVVILLIPA